MSSLDNVVIVTATSPDDVTCGVRVAHDGVDTFTVSTMENGAVALRTRSPLAVVFTAAALLVAYSEDCDGEWSATRREGCALADGPGPMLRRLRAGADDARASRGGSRATS